MSILRKKFDAYRTGQPEPLPDMPASGSFLEKAMALFGAVVTVDIDYDNLPDFSDVTAKAIQYEKSRKNPVGVGHSRGKARAAAKTRS